MQARRARSTTLPARFRDYAIKPEDLAAATSPFSTWSEGSIGRKRGRADRVMGIRELKSVFAESQAAEEAIAPAVDADELADVLFGGSTPLAPDGSNCISPCNAGKKQLRLSPPSSPTEEVETLAMLEALVAQEEQSWATPVTSFHGSPRASTDDDDDDVADDAFTDEVSSLFQLMGAEDSATTPFDLLAEPDIFFGEGMPPLTDPPLSMPPLPPSAAPSASGSMSGPSSMVLDGPVLPTTAALVAAPSAAAAMPKGMPAAELAAFNDKAIPRNVAERKEWSASEDELIRSNVESHGCRWRIIASMLPGRSDDAVRNRWNRLKEAQNPRLPANVNGEAGLTEGSGKSSGRSGGKYRGSSSADGEGGSKPERISWSRQEDETIVSSVADFGHKWGKIALRLPGRTEHAIRNRYSRLQTMLMELEKQPELPSLPVAIAAC
mmetsp:Transcript_18858/g.48187  ORF Transcript_18858/g.48187 Transcript_18858/m.48187 type:complete len:438 (-) Transcript_18858:223-1536(-)